MKLNSRFWKNKKVFVTGHTGFKGSWLTLILKILGAKVYGYALNPISRPNFFDGVGLSRFLEKDYRNNIQDIKKLKSAIKNTKPSVVIHLAAQSSVLVSYIDPIDTIKSNVIGTMNILEAIKNQKSVKVGVIITTDKVYLNLEKKKKFKENEALGGHDLYSGSKAASEIIFQSYKKSFFQNTKCNISTVRSGNCIGGGDWTKDRIMKDCAEKLIHNKKLIIRRPKATRPWQHVIEPLVGYLLLVQKMYRNSKYSSAWNFGPGLKNNLKVIDFVKFCQKTLKSKSKIKIIKNKLYESTNLALDSSKSFKYLNWKTIFTAKEAIKYTLDWYKFYFQSNSRKKIISFSQKQIKNYLTLLNKRG
jgi:CDP-glucose 4,6-dehydratase